ncbi:hypothetical protein SY2F82_70600 [Streptomyces sp. Y2F8-2]|nr:hypothetical protein SY2F82_70600 [Streptomyces sp. Y2F8-2]
MPVSGAGQWRERCSAPVFGGGSHARPPAPNTGTRACDARPRDRGVRPSAPAQERGASRPGVELQSRPPLSPPGHTPVDRSIAFAPVRSARLRATANRAP